MSRYAQNTDVSSARSREEIERTLARYGATGFMYGWTDAAATVAFEMRGRRVRFVVRLPDRRARDITHTPSRGTVRSAAQQEGAYEQLVRQRWRALALVIKAKLEAVESEITTFEDEFMAHIVLPNGGTVGEFMAPQIARAYATGNMPPLLPAPGGQQ